MALPDEYKRAAAPGVLDLSIFVGGSGQSWQRDVWMSHGAPLGPTDLTGVTPTAEVRSLDDGTVLATIAAAVVAPAAGGQVRLTMTKVVADAIAWPGFGAPNGSTVLRGRWHLALDDGATRAVVLRGDVEVIR